LPNLSTKCDKFGILPKNFSLWDTQELTFVASFAIFII
jgi:hypothetical protein